MSAEELLRKLDPAHEDEGPEGPENDYCDCANAGPEYLGRDSETDSPIFACACCETRERRCARHLYPAPATNPEAAF
jgi:hypothetical protein